MATGILGDMPKRFPLAFILFLVFILSLVLAPARATGAFYSTAAQIIPVLLLVLALEARIFKLMPTQPVSGAPGAFGARFQRITDPSNTGAAWVNLGMGTALIALCIGEFSALQPLVSGHAEDGNVGNVYAALATGFTAIAYLAIVPDRETT